MNNKIIFLIFAVILLASCITITYADETEKLLTVLQSEAVSDLQHYTIVSLLTDQNNTSLSNQTLDFSYSENLIDYSYIGFNSTNESGISQISWDSDGLFGNYTLKIEYNGSDVYLPASDIIEIFIDNETDTTENETNITVNETDTTENETNITVKELKFNEIIITLGSEPQPEPMEGEVYGMILFWNGTSGNVPSGWTCISCNPGDAFYDKFIIGNSTYGTTGGAATHSHTLTWVSSTSSVSAGSNGGSAGTSAAGVHAHNTLGSQTVTAASNLPSYRTLIAIKYNNGIPTTIPAGAIAIFNSTLPTNWTQYSAQDNYFVAGNGTLGTTGGSNTHTHPTSITTGGPSLTSGSGSGTTQPSSTHTHTNSSTSNSTDQRPPYLNVILAKADSATTIPNGMISMFNSTPGTNWETISGSGKPFYEKFIVGSATYGGTGGLLSHTHANAMLITTTYTGAADDANTGAGTRADTTHTHNITVSFNTSANRPPYSSAIFAYYSLPPDTSPPTYTNNASQLVTTYSSLAYSNFSITWNDANFANASLENNFSGSLINTSMSGLYPNFYYNSTPLAAGIYQYRFVANDTGGYSNATPLLIFTIAPATPVLHIAINGSETNKEYAAGNITNVTAWETNSVDSSCVYTLYRNTTSIGTGSVVSDVQTLSAGNYTYIYNTTGCVNFTTATVTRLLNITPVDTILPTYSNNVSQLITTYSSLGYSNFSITWNDANFANASLENNFSGSLINTSMSGLYPNFYYNSTPLAAGIYQYRFVGNDTFGNSNATDLVIFTISKAANPVNLYLNGTQNSNRTYTYPESINATGTSLAGTPTLYRDGASVINPEEILLGNGTYAYKVNATGNTNYSDNATGLTYYALVNKQLTNLIFSVNQTVYPQGRSPGHGYDIYIPFQANYSDSLGQAISGASCYVTNNETSDNVTLTYNATSGNYTGNVTDYMMYDVVGFNATCSKTNYYSANNTTTTNVWFYNYLWETTNQSYSEYNNYTTHWLMKENATGGVYTLTQDISTIIGENSFPNLFSFCASGINCSFLKDFNMYDLHTLRLNLSINDTSCEPYLCIHVKDWHGHYLSEECGLPQAISANTPTMLEQNITANYTITQQNYLSLHLHFNCSAEVSESVNIYYNYTGQPANMIIYKAVPKLFATYMAANTHLESDYLIGPNQTANSTRKGWITFNNTENTQQFTEYWFLSPISIEYQDNYASDTLYIYNSTGQLWASDNSSAGAPYAATAYSNNRIMWQTESVPALTAINETVQVKVIDALRNTETLIYDSPAEKIWNITVLCIFLPEIITENVTIWTNYSTYGVPDSFNFNVNVTNSSGTFNITDQIIVNNTDKTITMPKTSMSLVNYTVTAEDTEAPAWSNNQSFIPTDYSSATSSEFNITWVNGVEVDKVFIEGNWSTCSSNCTMTNVTYGGSIYNYSEVLPAGTYYWKSYANDTSDNWNTSDTWYFTISQADNLLTLSTLPATTVTYPNTTVTTCSAAYDTPTLYRNGSSLTNQTNDTILLGAGTYNYSCNVSASQNYSFNETYHILTVNINSTNPIDLYLGNGTVYKNQDIVVEYGNPVTVNSTLVYSSSGASLLWRNGTSISNPNTSALPIGIYEYKGNTSGNTNYSANDTGVLYFVYVKDITDPNVTWISQTPDNLTSFNAISNPLNITYNISDGSGINNDTVKLFYKTNTTSLDCASYTNGTLDPCGYKNISYFSNTTDMWLFRIMDNQIYPATYNIDETYLEATSHSAYLLDAANKYIKIRLLNVSSAKQYSLFEVMANNTNIAGTQSLRVYYCNSSYTSGAVPNSYCTNFYNIPAQTLYNHTHTSYSSHQLVPFAMNNTTGFINGIKVTDVSYFLLQGRNDTSAWDVYYISDVSMTDTIQTSADSGAGWVNLTGTVDAHLHQYDGTEMLWYYACANDTADNENCSAERYDLIDLAGMPPSAPYVYSPVYGTYDGNITINYTEAISPSGYLIGGYNITLLDENESFVLRIDENNYPDLSYVWDSTGTAEGVYYIKVEICDSLNQCSYGLSDNFTINYRPNVTIGSPLGETYNFNVSIFIAALISDNDGINTSFAYVTLPNTTIRTLTLGLEQQSDDFDTDTLDTDWYVEDDTVNPNQTCVVDIDTTISGKAYTSLEGDGSPGFDSLCSLLSTGFVCGDFDMNVTFNITASNSSDYAINFGLSETNTSSSAVRQIFIALSNWTGENQEYEIFADDGNSTGYILTRDTDDTYGKFRIKRVGNTFSFYTWNNTDSSWINESVSSNTFNMSSGLFIYMESESLIPGWGTASASWDDFSIYSNNCSVALFDETSASGTYSIRINATDNLGLYNDEETTYFRIDSVNLPPSIPWSLLPVNNATIQGLYNITWTKSIDPNNDSLRYNITLLNTDGTINSTLVTDYGSSSTQYYTWDTTLYWNGNYSVKVIVYENETTEHYSAQDNYVANFTVENDYLPSIIFVEDIGSQNPNEGSIKTVAINFTARDMNGVDNMNYSAAAMTIIGNANPLINYTNTSCENWINDTITANFTCSFYMNYYDDPQDYMINVSISDITNNGAFNDSANFTYNQLKAWTMNLTSLDFGSLMPEASAGAINDPILINNTGNSNLTFNITAYDLIGTVNALYFIPAENFTANIADNAAGDRLINNSEKNITSGDISYGLTATRELYFWIDTVPYVMGQTYNTSALGAWVIKGE